MFTHSITFRFHRPKDEWCGRFEKCDRLEDEQCGRLEDEQCSRLEDEQCGRLEDEQTRR